VLHVRFELCFYIPENGILRDRFILRQSAFVTSDFRTPHSVFVALLIVLLTSMNL
jgi:hypothetical protein